MSGLIIFAALLVYVFIGVVVAYALEGSPDFGEVVLGAIWWPVMLLILLVFGFFNLAIGIGTWIHEKIIK